ncbi:MAG: bifunctional 3-phenylpropionate/cinnamic acid dioxygenase ferredoxin subunit [Chloroflexota bacterium]
MTVSQWIRVADVTQIEPDTGLRVEVEDFPLALWNVGGNFYATADTCSHEEASLSEGDVWDGKIECPLHGAQFNPATGEAVTLPAILPIATFPVKVEGNSLYVEWSTEG